MKKTTWLLTLSMILSAVLLSSAGVFAGLGVFQSHANIQFSPDPESVFSRGQMVVELAMADVVGTDNLYTIDADGNGSVSVEE